MGCIIIELAALCTLAFASSVWLIVPIFVIHHAVNPFIFFCLDLFLIDYSKNEETGSVRGIFLTVANLAAIIATFTLSFILVKNEFWKAYAISAICLLPLFFLLFHSFRNFRDPEYKPYKLITTIRTRLANKDIYNIFIDNFLLQLFYSFTNIL